MKNPVLFLVVTICLLIGVAACGPKPTVEVTQTAATAPADTGGLATVDPALPMATVPPAGEAYPPALAEPQDAYPAGGQAVVEESYPAPVSEEFLEPRFRIGLPVSAGATTITGQAPPDVALAIMDVSYNGALLGTGRSDANGAFSIPVSGLIAGNRIGLTVGELQEGQTLEQMAELYFPHRGEGFMNVPNLGIFFDTTLVEP